MMIIVLEVKHLAIHNKTKQIVKGVSFTIEQGQWIALVGESGSGKSITAASIGGLLPSGVTLKGGSITFKRKGSASHHQPILGKDISYIFQDYRSAFTPFLTIGKQFDETIRTHSKLSKKDRTAAIFQALKAVNLPNERVYKSYASQLSGGQLQRAAIALALMMKPALIIADEPTTALDSVAAAEVLQLLHKLKEEAGCAILFITHDLRHVRKYADRAAIMLAGEIVEENSIESLFHAPHHFYTKKLFNAIPSLQKTPDRLLDTQKKVLI
ncbi:ABC transporter ATP-binding protein [Priestia megaterium]|uniref:ABC transporter ATP-binding protein n=1 Tax=Priestia megaterium TaxID=1404 RepID=UPI00286D3AC7|nr:ABC transporter ATP-binding protein [Priestia megaterium]